MAERLCEPPPNAAVARVALPPVTVPVPKVFAPSRKVTVPVMLPGVPEVMFAVRVMD